MAMERLLGAAEVERRRDFICARYLKHKPKLLPLVREVMSDYPNYVEAMRGRVKEVLKKRNDPSKTDNKRRLLTPEAEAQLVGMLQAYFRMGIGFTVQQIIAHVRMKFDLDESWCGDSWAYRFLKRQSNHISYGESKPLDIDRVKRVSRDTVQNFMTCADQVHEEIAFQADFVFNIDESGASMTNRRSKIIIDRSFTHGGTVKVPNDALRTTVPIIQASGKVFMILHIYCVSKSLPELLTPEPYSPDNKAISTRGDFDYYMAVTASGYMNKTLWEAWIAVFCRKAAAQMNGASGLIFMDRLSSHMSPTTLDLLLSNNIEVLYLPPHTTHIAQPLDQYPLANLKHKIVVLKQQEVTERLMNGKPLHGILSTIITIAEYAAFTPQSIIASFRDTGLYPWNRDIFTSLFEEIVVVHPQTKVERNLEALRIESLKKTLAQHKRLTQKPETRKLRHSASDYSARGSLVVTELEARKQSRPAATPRKRARKETPLPIEQLPQPIMQQESSDSDDMLDVEVGPMDDAVETRFYCISCHAHRPSKLEVWSCALCVNARLCSDCVTYTANIDWHTCQRPIRRTRVAKAGTDAYDDVSIVTISSNIHDDN